MKPLKLFTDGQGQYYAAVEYSKSLDIRAHFAACPEYGIKTYIRFSKLMEAGEYWKYKEEIPEFYSITLNEVIDQVFPNGYTYATFTKFLSMALGYDAFVSIIVSSICTNEVRPNPSEIINKLRRALISK